jgi:hypothetical protein
MNPTETPYRDWAFAYWEAGWRGVLPLPPGAKWPPPEGFTGAGGAWPSYADVHAWTEERPTANIGIRLPPDVIGLDVDTYGSKRGAETMANAVAVYGELPPTFSVTARAPGMGSGIFLYRVPPGLRWPGEVGPHVEIIQTRHRYMVAAPSIHPDLPEPYRIYAGLGVPIEMGERIPRPDGIPELPAAWVDGLALTSGGDVEKGDVTDAEVSAWLKENQTGICRIMFARLGRILEDLTAGQGSRHDVALRGLMAFAHLSREGHTGATHAVQELGKVWIPLVTSAGDGQRGYIQACAEWERMISGAVAMSHAYGDPGRMPDPCYAASAESLVPAGEDGGALAGHNNEPPARFESGREIPGQGAAVPGPIVPPPWVTAETDGVTPGALTPGIAGPPPGVTDAMVTAVEQFDRHAVAVQLELERLEVRRDARLELARAEHLKGWREPPGYSLRELLALPDEPLSWRVADVMPEGSNVLLAAQYKTGKTTLMNELIRSLADGEDFLGAFKVAPGTVAVFNYEVGVSQYARWLRDRGIAHPDAVHVLNLRGFTTPLNVPLVRSYVVEWLTRREIKVWIVDPFARAFSGSGNENENADVAPFLEILDGIKEEAGVLELVMPTHTGRAEFAPGTERARGATRLDDWCDVRWLLTKDDEGHRYFRASGRDVETEETRLEFDPLTRALTLGSGARPPKATRGGRRAGSGAQNGAGAFSGPLEDVVLEALWDKPGMGAGELREEVRRHGSTARNREIDEAARRLIQQGRIRVDAVRQPQGGRPLKAHYATGEAPNVE